MELAFRPSRLLAAACRAMLCALSLCTSKSSTEPSGNVKVLYPLFSAQYNAEHWTLTSEYGWIAAQRFHADGAKEYFRLGPLRDDAVVPVLMPRHISRC